jgi:hypothetical protein
VRDPRWQRGAWWCVFAACLVYAVRAALFRASAPLGFYDEGLLFTDAFLMNQGQAIYRDFYANYPPGIFQVIRLVMALGLPPIWTERVLAVSVDVACAVGAGLVAGRLRGERFCLAAASVLLLLRASLGLTLNAYRVAVLLALVTMALWPEETSGRGRRIACGVSLGLVSYFRLDLFGFAVLLLGALEAGCALMKRRSLLAASARQLAELAGAAAGTVLILWVPLVVQAGWSRVLHDLVIDQASGNMPGRTLPLPQFGALVEVPWLGLHLPALLARRVCVGLVLAAAGTAAAAVALLVRAARTPLPARELRNAALLAAFAAAVLPNALMRTGYWHVSVGLPLGVAALFGTLGARRIGLPVLLLGLLATFAERPPLAPAGDALRFLRPRDDVEFISPPRRRLVRFLDAETGGGERIFVGCTSHRRTMCSYLDVYYLAGRAGATRHMQFDPGVTTSAEGQSEMIADLERHRPRIALRHPKCAWYEPNASQVEGSTLLDDYLAARYAPSGTLGEFEIWRRR